MQSTRLTPTLALGFITSLCSVAAIAQDFADVEIKATHVAGKVYMLEGRGGNIGASVGSDGILIVDDQFAPLADKIQAALADIDKGAIAFVLNTHWHGDHTGGNAQFGRDATIIAHDNVRKRLSGDLKPTDREAEAQPKAALPVITFADSLTIHFNDEEIRVLHHPHSHTDGDAVIHFTGSNVVHLGDIFFSGLFPFVDLGSGGDVLGYTKTVARLLKELPEDAKLIPGHGPLSGHDELVEYHRMLVETTELVRKARAAGRDLESIKKQGVPKQYESWSWSFISADKWLETIYRSLERHDGK